MVEELYFSSDGKSLRRGKRAAKRRLVERVVHIWRTGETGDPVEGIATDISTDGLLVQTDASFAVGDEIMVDVKRNKDANSPTFLYARARVVRLVAGSAETAAVGIKLIAKERKPD